MIPLLSREAVRALDADAVERLGMQTIVLMENAGRGATEVLLGRLPQRAERVVVVGGPGQNGGDGWVVARHLHNRGYSPLGVLVGEEHKVKGDARVNLDTLRALGVEVRVTPSDALGVLDEALQGATLVVDALFGTGLDRPVAGGYAEVIQRIDACEAPCMALDLPSGLDADTGQVLGVAPHAALTATFGAHKRGLHQHPGVDHAGDVNAVSIGIPWPRESAVALMEPADVRATVESRAESAHKGTAGHVLVVAGSPGRTGAAMLSGVGALRGGAGLVTLASRGAARDALDQKVVELMTAGLAEEGTRAAEQAVELADGMQAAVIGPGLGTDAAGRQTATELARRLPVAAALDADALTAVADGELESLQDAAAPRVLTPHPGEAARLLGEETGAIQRDRYGAALRLAQRTGQTVVLKGARTVVAAPGGTMRVCPYSVPALASAGTGDVLSGAVAARLAATEPFDAAAQAVFLHALAGMFAAQGDRGLFAREVADALPRALADCRATAG